MDTTVKNSVTEVVKCNNSYNIDNCYSNLEYVTTLQLTYREDSYVDRAWGFLIIGITGIFANTCTILILGSCAKIRQKLVNTLIIHQSFVDLFASVGLVGTAHIDITDQHGLNGVEAVMYCFFVATKWPFWTMTYVSTFSLVFLNIERYISIANPIYHRTNVTRRRVSMLLPIVWWLGIIEQSFVASNFIPKNGACGIGSTSYYENMIWITSMTFVVLNFFVPVALVTVLYGHMIFRLRSSMNSENDATSTRRNDVMEKAKNNVFKTMLLITICYAICYVFNSSYVTLYLFGIIKSFSGKYISHWVLNTTTPLKYVRASTVLWQNNKTKTASSEGC